MAALAAVFVIHLRCFFVIPLTGLDMFASDIETCKHVSASLGSIVIPVTFVIPDPVPGGNLHLSCLHVRVREIHRWCADANVFENLGPHIAQPVDFLLCKTHDIACFKRNFLIVGKQ